MRIAHCNKEIEISYLVLPGVERQNLWRDTLMICAYEDSLLPVHENIVDLLLSYGNFSTDYF